LRSKKRSGASSRSKPPEPTPPPLFVDRSLGRHVIPDALRALGVEVHVHDDYFPQDAPDDVWLPVVGQRGWAVLTKDTKIRLRDTELSALVRGRVRAFVLTSGDMTGLEMARVLTLALPQIARLCLRHGPPFIARVSRRGAVQLIYDSRRGMR
jgi:hypothetical protein